MSETEIQLASNSKLNYQQILFCENIVKGLNNKDAYANAYPSANELTTESASSTLISLPKIKEYIYSLKAIQSDSKQGESISRELIAKCRRSIIQSTDPATKDSDKLTACRDHASQEGYSTPLEVEHSFKVVWGE